MTAPSESPVNILLVDDRPENLLTLEAILGDLGQNLVRASSGEEALRQLLLHDFAVVLLDVQMRGLDGFETAQLIRSRKRSRHTPIIFITAYASDEFSPAKAYTLGAVDYLIKPLTPEILRAKVEVVVTLFQQAEQVRQLEARRLADEALRAGEQRFRAIIENSWDAIALLGDDAIVRYASPATARIIGYSPEAFVGRNAFEFMHPDDLQRTKDIFSQLVQNAGTTLTATFQFRHQDGSWRWLEATGTGMLNEPSIQAIVVNYHDVSEHKRAEEAISALNSDLQRRVAEFQALLDVAPVGIAVSNDPLCHDIRVNPMFARMLGVPLQANIPLAALPERQPARKVYRDGKELSGDELPLQYAARHGVELRSIEIDIVPEGASAFTLLGNVSPLRNERGEVQGCVGAFMDISDMKRLETELRQRAEQLAEAARQKDQFLAMLAHELRNPLTPIRNGLHILRQAQTSPPAREQTREMMERQVVHLTRLVDDLLDVSRITRGNVQLRRERMDLGRLARATAEDRRPDLAQAGLTLRLDIPDTPIWIMGDATRLEQILQNLLDNTVKFSDGGSFVSVQVTADPERQEAIMVVRDDAIGIEPELLPRLFSPFAQADRSLDRSRGGLGLGLALVKGLAELHGGGVQASSGGTGQGAEITVRLPLEHEPAALTQTLTVPKPTGGSRRVLIIEDQRDAADSLRTLLELLGYRVRVAYSGPDGVEAAGEWRPEIVLCDIGLPGLDGYGVARELRLNPTTARVRLLAITGYGSDEDRRRSQQAGFDLHLVKPVDPDELLRLMVP